MPIEVFIGAKLRLNEIKLTLLIKLLNWLLSILLTGKRLQRFCVCWGYCNIWALRVVLRKCRLVKLSFVHLTLFESGAISFWLSDKCLMLIFNSGYRFSTDLHIRIQLFEAFGNFKLGFRLGRVFTLFSGSCIWLLERTIVALFHLIID